MVLTEIISNIIVLTKNNACAIVSNIMSEVLRLAGEMLPYAGATIVGAGGLIIDRINRIRSTEQAQSFSDVLGSQHLQVQEPDSDTVSPNSYNFRSRITESVGVMACAGALAGGLAGAAFSFDYKEPHNSATPVQIVVDRSGKTITQGEGESAKAIDEITTVFDKKFGDKVEAQVAQKGSVEEVGADEVKDIEPQGTARMGEALRVATKSSEDTHVVVLVDGNKDLPGVNVEDGKLSVINVGDSSDSMEEYAKESNGQYFEANPKNAEDIADKVAKNIDPKADDGQIIFKFPSAQRILMSGLATIGFAGAFFTARRKKIIRDENNVTQVGV